MPHNLISRAPANCVPITVIAPGAFDDWLGAASDATGKWLTSVGFSAKEGKPAMLPGDDGGLARVLFVQPDDADLWTWSALAAGLPSGSYRIEGKLGHATAADAALGWALAGYEFSRYRKPRRSIPDLVWPAGADRDALTSTIEATFLVRDLITTPAEDMGPAQLAAAARTLGRRHKATVRVTTGDQLLKQNYPAIHAVGRACDDPPRLIDLSWGATKDPKVTLVGKGVCFDTGGLDLKGAAGMLLMKKDMGGSAHVLGLAAMIMAAKLPVRLRVLIPAVENSVAGNAFHPLDVLTMRNGMTVEVGNTDAEGRLVLADCLVRACEEKPALLIDYATLTGAARVALGPGLPAIFTNDDAFADSLAEIGDKGADPLWRMPLHKDYRRMLDSAIADISSTGGGGHAGAITAALFLSEFVDADIPWVHIDVMAWNPRSRPGRPEGGEAMGMRTVYAAIAQRFGKATARKSAKSKARGKKPAK